MITKYFQNRMISAFRDSEGAISNFLCEFAKNKKVKILDAGCGNGKLTNKFIENVSKISDVEIFGVDMLDDNLVAKNIIYCKQDLTNKLTFCNNYFDIIIANQVIEHLLDKDHFLNECFRILKNGGLFMCCTDNISSWDNIVSLLLGQEPLSQHTGSKFVTNSFLSPHFMKKIEEKSGNFYMHKNVCSYYGVQRLIKIAGFKNLKIKTFGNLCKFFELLFPIYNRIILISSTKKL